jgi:hypothetical protein
MLRRARASDRVTAVKAAIGYLIFVLLLYPLCFVPIWFAAIIAAPCALGADVFCCFARLAPWTRERVSAVLGDVLLGATNGFAYALAAYCLWRWARSRPAVLFFLYMLQIIHIQFLGPGYSARIFERPTTRGRLTRTVTCSEVVAGAVSFVVFFCP